MSKRRSDYGGLLTLPKGDAAATAPSECLSAVQLDNARHVIIRLAGHLEVPYRTASALLAHDDMREDVHAWCLGKGIDLAFMRQAIAELDAVGTADTVRREG